MFFAYNGYNAACNMAEEVRHPSLSWFHTRLSKGLLLRLSV